ncbi:MAG: Glucosamine-fructose-6-phosphate aminotransferase, isomerizing [uncultured bacterium (gcode 4)]|uniref:Glutamine--fructose-6-phosphate aminotransferase [isomerizing] n=1 Tax=uncultured bacterium (gcode 4) TaxID=1234023 RepID=K2G4Y3_9BACT|nr:MAG: Glucosamine-fructose-6-phosphate aminotransferase, isomerizing [uncultured bacterium (gcode 4)]
MCGIFWYIGKEQNASKVLLDWLQKLEYRWYDSAWMAVWNDDEDIKVIKAVGKVSSLAEKRALALKETDKFTYWIAHTRWATHGWVTESNCHPHYDDNSRVKLVHNWIIENYKELKDELIAKWYKFYWDTDSEVAAKYIDDNWQWTLLKTVEYVLPKFEWAYAFLFISRENPNEIVWVKYWSPLVFGYSDKTNEFYFSSDTQALAWYADELIYLDDWELVYVAHWDYIIKSQGKLIVKSIEKIDVESLQSDKWSFAHFMLKEIHEQPAVLSEVFRWRVDFDNSTLNSSAFQDLDKYTFKKVVFIACWTSYHAWWLGSLFVEDLASMDARVEVASEFEYKNVTIDQETLYVFISQSGETADSIEPLKYIKSQWGKTFWIVNVVWSTISRLTDFWLFTRAWTEVGVASTKAFVAQIATILLLALYFWDKKWLNRQKYKQIINELKNLPRIIQEVILTSESIKVVANEMSKYKQFFFLWRHLELPIAFEASLKFKEISYLNSQALPTGELKHWSLALIENEFPCVMFVPKNFLLEKNLSSIQEIKARKWKVLAISDTHIPTADWMIWIPQVIDTLQPFALIVAGQLLAYHTANILGHEIDRPRNLAKSVTVK